MRIVDYLENKRKNEQVQQNLVRIYNDIAILLWYKVLYDDILIHKRDKMDNQNEAFRIFQWGNRNMIFGPVKALTLEEDKKKFIKTAQAELRDCGYGNLKVSVYPDSIIISR